MAEMIESLSIQNYKSVKKISLKCERINIFIGRPNAGKSNILEAISLLGARYTEERFMEGLIRYKNIPQLFSDFIFENPITVKSNTIIASLSASSDVGSTFQYSLAHNNELASKTISFGMDTQGLVSRDSRTDRFPGQVKKYEFKGLSDYQDKGLFLHPPHGDNLYLIVRSHPQLIKEIQAFLKPNGLDLLIDEESQRLVVVKTENGRLFSFPLHLLPDTFLRYIFHISAILSNKDSVLLLEEPESHAYPPYIYQLAQHILDDKGGNQYFLTTHNPYFLQPLIQEAKDVALFVTWYENYHTHVRRLNFKEVASLLDDGVDIFMNLENYIPK